jgi:hypothetical protein
MSEIFKISSRILCEEIRQEKSNKYVLLGVFAGDIFVEKFPATAPFAFYFEGHVEQAGDYPFLVRVSGPGEGKAILSVRYTSHVDNGIVAIVTPRLEVTLESAGVFKIETSEDEENWTTQIERSVKRGENLWSLVPHRATPVEVAKDE